ncbi:MAG: hypothetical protein WCQ69_09095 [Bacteroidales bacterium]
MNKFETPPIQPKSTVEKIKETKQELEPFLSKPEENKEEISVLAKKLEALNSIIETEVKKEIEEAFATYNNQASHTALEFRPHILEVLSHEKSQTAREYVALNPNTPKEILEKLSEYHRRVREVVAKNPNTPKETLEKLSQDKEDDVRMSVARNRNASLDILQELSRDSHKNVRAYVAMNPNTPKETLEKLYQDEVYIVKMLALKRLKEYEQV